MIDFVELFDDIDRLWQVYWGLGIFICVIFWIGIRRWLWWGLKAIAIGVAIGMIFTFGVNEAGQKAPLAMIVALAVIGDPESFAIAQLYPMMVTAGVASVLLLVSYYFFNLKFAGSKALTVDEAAALERSKQGKKGSAKSKKGNSSGGQSKAAASKAKPASPTPKKAMATPNQSAEQADQPSPENFAPSRDKMVEWKKPDVSSTTNSAKEANAAGDQTGQRNPNNGNNKSNPRIEPTI